MGTVTVFAVNRKKALVVIDDGTVLPITNWLDLDGEDCAEPDAVAAVAGNDAYGWVTTNLDDYMRLGH